MDILRKELNAIYDAQRLEEELLDGDELIRYGEIVRSGAGVDNDCCVITDASNDTCYIYGGAFADLLGLFDRKVGEDVMAVKCDSSDEDAIYMLLHPEDLVEKRMLEYEFFTLMHKAQSEQKRAFKACCRIRMRQCNGEYVMVDNSSQILALSPAGKIWLILCKYSLSPNQRFSGSIESCIINNGTGEVRQLSLSSRREHILTTREKEVLQLIRDGLPSKLIAYRLGISIHTVNRHRQNILEKLSVDSSMEAVLAAVKMNLL